MTTSGKQLATLIVRWPGTAGNETTTPPLPPLLLLFTPMSLRTAAKKLNTSLALSGPLLIQRAHRLASWCHDARLDTPFASRPSNRWEDSPSADGSYFIERRSRSLRSHLTAWSATGCPRYEKGHGFDHAFYKGSTRGSRGFRDRAAAHPTEGSQGERTSSLAKLRDRRTDIFGTKNTFSFFFFFLSDSVDGRVKVEDGKREWFERGWDVRKL